MAVVLSQGEVAVERADRGWYDRDDASRATLATPDGDQTGIEVEVIASQRDQLAGADASLEHEPDDGFVAAVVEGFVGSTCRRGAGGDQGA